MKSIPIKILVRNDLNCQAQSQVEVIHLSVKGRLGVALKTLGICWGLGILFIFIPVMHFVLVPAAVLSGIFMFWQKMKLQEFLVSGKIKCPKCNVEWDAKPAAFNWPKRETCAQCQAELIIEN